MIINIKLKIKMKMSKGPETQLNDYPSFYGVNLDTFWRAV